MKYLAYHAAGATSSSSPTDTSGGGGGGTTSGSGAGLDFTNLSNLLTNNIVPIAATILGIGIFFLARKKKLADVFEKAGAALVAFAIIAMGLNSLGIDIATKALHTLFG